VRPVWVTYQDPVSKIKQKRKEKKKGSSMCVSGMNERLVLSAVGGMG
jgi:hypothetical protein